MFGSVAARAEGIESKLMLYIVVGIIALVIINLLLDGIRRFIRGLDTAALGVLFIWLGYQSGSLTLVSVLTNLLYLIGITLLICGILVFIVTRLIRHKRAVKKSGPPMPKEEPAAKEPEPEE